MGVAVKPVTEKQDAAVLQMEQGILERDTSAALLRLRSFDLDGFFISLLHKWSIPGLRVSLGVVFLWFGTLKLLGISPVLSLVQQTYSFLPLHAFFWLLSIWEIGIGCGLILKRALRFTLVLLCVHLIGTFIALLQAPSLFFLHNNPLWLTAEGEFVMKNLVLVAAGLVIGGHEVKPRTKAGRIRMVNSK